MNRRSGHAVQRAAGWVLCLGLAGQTAIAEEWPEVFNPFKVETINFEVDPNDWETLKQDTNTSFPELVFRTSALMWATGETNKLLVQIRQGKDDPIPSFSDPRKVGIKVDINDLVPGQEWRGLKKLSLENGNGGSGVIREAVAMNLHRLAAEAGFYDYPNGYATWVRVVVNSNYLGLYSFPEQRDKQFMRNRGIYKPGASWLYEYNTDTILDTTVAPTNSPTFDALCFPPFNTLCPQPSDPSVALGMEAALEEWIDMRSMLTLAAIESFIAYGDGLFTKGNKNVFSTEFHPSMQQKRKYYAWDLDSGFSDTAFDIYSGGPGQQSKRVYQNEILGHYWFRDVYRQIYSDLINGPLSLAALTDFIDQIEVFLTPYVDEDPYVGGAGEFSSIRQYFTNRIANVRSQIGAVTGPPQFSHSGREIRPGFQLSLVQTNTAGTIYYTLDGSDPRGLGGTILGTEYTGPLSLTNTSVVTCRTLTSTNWSALRQSIYNVADHALPIKVTEIMYRPLPSTNAGPGNLEFIELKNTGTHPVNLSGCSFTGIGYTFSPGTIVAPGAFIVLVNHPLAFEERYPGIPYHGVYLGGLSQFGEKIRLRNSDGNNIFSVEYDDAPPWVQGANGFGYSLVNINLSGNPDDPANWRESAAIHGSPGADDPAPPYMAGIVVNEVVAHTDPPLEDAIELYNPTTNDIDISGWYLSDKMDLLDSSRASLKKYRIPGGTVIPAQGYKVFYEADFNPAVTNADALVKFALSSRGEEVWLATADGSGALTGHITGFRFGASDNGVSIGRHLTSTGADVAFLDHHSFGEPQPASVTDFRTGPGAANSSPRVGPVILNELMYHPDDGANEFVELLNTSPQSIDLAGWSLEGANYIFPANSLIEAQGLLILLATTNVSAETFRLANQVPGAVPILQHAFDLQNAGELLSLGKPNDPPTDPAIIVDRIRYNDRAPWPTEADGKGPSLERATPSTYANDPANWRTSTYGGTPGQPGSITTGILIATNSSWKYNALGSDLGTVWQASPYSDSGWPSGRGVLGYGPPSIDSVIEISPASGLPTTTYFRKDFVINDDPGALSHFEIGVNYNGGFVAYINGTEVARRSMPAGPVFFDTLASHHSGGSYEIIDLLPHTNTLTRGSNVLAVEVHQTTLGDTNLIWNALLTYGRPPAIPPFWITGISIDSDELLLNWAGTSGTTYYVQESDDLEIWTDVSVPLQSGGPTSQYAHPILPGDSQGFYRIRMDD